MNNYEKHAWNEFKAAGWLDENDNFKDEMQESICMHVAELLKVFSKESHSGSSAPYAVEIFSKLALFKPIAPLTGEDWEWNDVGDGVYQNKRCSYVFKQADCFDGQAYDINGKVFWEWFTDEYGDKHKTYYTSSESFTPVTFPYSPQTEYLYKESGAK